MHNYRVNVIVSDLFEYKLSKLIHSLLTCTPKLSEALDKLIVKIDSIHTRTTRNNHQVYSRRAPRGGEGGEYFPALIFDWNFVPYF